MGSLRITPGHEIKKFTYPTISTLPLNPEFAFSLLFPLRRCPAEQLPCCEVDQADTAVWTWL